MINPLRRLYNKYYSGYIRWANSWSRSQLIFVFVIVLAMWATMAFISYKLDEAYKVIDVSIQLHTNEQATP